MTSKDKITEITSSLLENINRELSRQAKNGNTDLCNLVEATVVARLDNASETGIIAKKIMKVMFPNENNQGLVTVDYDKEHLTIKAIINLR
jgi:hypothetical protein